MEALPSTADVVDEHADEVDVCELPLRAYGGRLPFAGTVTTVRCFEDNVLLRTALTEPGAGRVLVVEGGGSLHTALLGDVVAGLAVESGWEGVVVHGAIRDSAALDVGVLALGTNPRRSGKAGAGERDVAVCFGRAVFVPGARLVADADGVVVFLEPSP
jgi:regulator of ribonuclease activity A